ncbi:MAG: 3-deoxy-7-phosphoheptulonate synthase [Deltaproteobacteria bacterium]|nr:MAG: 3-deoxy-7-phosphoheptulonate synthase [Deltaproteobacteria bacterium]
MLIVLHTDVSPAQQAAIEARVRELGFTPHPIEGAGRTAIGITGNKGPIDPGHFRLMEGVAECIPVTAPYKLVSREVKHDDTVVDVAGVPIGGRALVVMAGPCAVESEQQILGAARGVAKSGASLLRGGAFKPRTSPYDFQGLKVRGLELLSKARAETGLKVVTEVKDTETLPAVAEAADLLQIGARNMQNFSLLEAVGDLRKPVLLKRGMSSTIKELLMAAEYIVSRGNKQVILCERGIRTFETMTRNTLDLNAVPMLKAQSHLPVVVDPSHGIGIRSAVLPMARAAVAAGADGLIIEVHPDPDRALSDGMQSLDLPLFAQLMREVEAVARAIGRSLYRMPA